MTYPKPTTKHKQYFLAGASGLVVSLLMFAMSTDHLNPDAVCNTDDGILTIDNFTLNDCESIILYLFYAMTLVSILGGFYIAYVVVHKHDVKRLRTCWIFDCRYHACIHISCRQHGYTISYH